MIIVVVHYFFATLFTILIEPHLKILFAITIYTHELLSILLVVLVTFINYVATPLWPSVGVKPNTSKVGDLEFSETPECLGFDSKAQNTSH